MLSLSVEPIQCAKSTRVGSNGSPAAVDRVASRRSRRPGPTAKRGPARARTAAPGAVRLGRPPWPPLHATRQRWREVGVKRCARSGSTPAFKTGGALHPSSSGRVRQAEPRPPHGDSRGRIAREGAHSWGENDSDCPVGSDASAAPAARWPRRLTRTADSDVGAGSDWAGGCRVRPRRLPWVQACAIPPRAGP